MKSARSFAAIAAACAALFAGAFWLGWASVKRAFDCRPDRWAGARA